MHFVLSNYGDKYFGYVFVCIYSIRKTNPDAKISLLWQDMTEDKIETLKEYYKDVDFVETSFNFSNDEVLRASSKNAVFNFAMNNLHFKENEPICLMDVDMIVLGNIESYFADDFDVGITDDPSRPTPLNAGLFLAKHSDTTKMFFEKWATDTNNIFTDPKKLAISLGRPYNAVEQMSLWELVDYPTLKGNIINSVEINGKTVKIKKLHCKELNHIYNGNIEKNTKVIHYKGVWNDFLIKGIIPSPTNFQKYKIFGNVFKEALSDLNQKLFSDFSQEFFNIRLHKLFYEDELKKYGLKYNIARNMYKIKNWLSKRFS